METVESIVRDLKELLSNVLLEADIEKKRELVWDFADKIVNNESVIISEEVDDIMKDLGIDLHEYEPNEAWRLAASSYYDDEGLKKEIEDTIENLRNIK